MGRGHNSMKNFSSLSALCSLWHFQLLEAANHQPALLHAAGSFLGHCPVLTLREGGSREK